MARIKRTWKKAPETNPKVVVLIKKFQELPDNELTVALEEAISVGWQWPRSDLMFWIPVLNRFDAYLETTVKNYDLRGPGSKKEKDADGKEIKEDDTNRIGVQINEFTPMTKRMTLAIFGFVKLLLENCTNRKLFCSYDRLNDFLLTTDTDVLLANLRLILRSAQQWSAQHQDMNGGFGISHTRLLDLLQSWSSIGGARSASLSLVDVVRKAVPSSQQLNDSPMDTGQPRFPQAAFMPEVVFQFYRKADTKPISHERSEANMGIKPSIDEKRKSKEFNTSTPAASSQTAASASVSNPMTTPKSRQKDRHTGTVTSPTQPNSTAIEGLAAIHVPSSTIAAATLPQDLLADLVDENALPLECRFKLFHRVRIAMSLQNRDQIIQMAVVRLLALAIYTHTTDEATAMSKLFIYEPGLISQLSELINLEIDDGSIAGDIQAAAFYALEGISRYRGKIAEVAGAVGVSVSHGILMQVIRRLAKELEKEQCRCTDEFIDSLFCFLSCLQLSAYAGSLLVGAGIVPVLVEICKSSHRKHMSTVTRAVTNLDGLMYGFSSAFGLFNQADGLKVFVNRIKEEVDTAITQCSTDDPSAIKSSELLIGMLPHSSAGLLKALFRSIQRLLTSAGTLESVRNLTETQLPAAIKLIIQNKSVFGYQIYSLAISMMSTLIHSEPTSLVILQEAGLPEALYDAIDEGIEPAFDVIAAIPSALGALCLNEVGLRQLNSRKAIQAIFSVFTREKHARILRDRDHATVVGGTIDELIRHQPSLKKTVLEATVNFLNEIHEIGKNIDPSAASLSRVLLKSEPKEIEQTKDVNDSQATLHHTQVISNDVIMSEPVAGPSIISQQPQLDAANKKEKDEKDAYLNNVVLLYIDVACRLLESMLQNVAHCQDFISMQGLDILLSLLRLPSIPYNFSITTAAEAFASTIRVLTETLPRETLLVVMKQLRSDLVDIRPFWETLRPQAMMLDMISPPPEKLDEYNFTFRRLISIQAYISFLSDICVASGYAHTRAASGILSVFTRPEESDTISYLGALQRVVFWEHILVKANAPKPWPESTGTAAINAASGVDSSSATLLIPMASMVGNEMESDASITANLTGQVSSSVSMTLSDVSNNSTVKLAESVPVTTHSETTFENTRGLRTVAAAISQSSGPLFSAMIKLLSSRRTQDDALKKQALETAAMLAQVLIGHLVWPGGEDPFSNFAYLTICLNTATQILTEVRGSRTTLNSLILSPFYNAKGLETILSLFGRYVDQADQFCKVENRNPSQNVLLVHLYGGLKVALDLLQNLCSSAALLESPHTALLQNWRDIVDPPFDAPALLISMRAMILTEISPLWKAEWLTLSPPNVVRGVVKILLDIIKAEGESLMEQPSDGSVSTTVGALMGATNTSLDRMAGVLSGVGPLSGPGYISTYPPIPGGRPSVVPDETRVASLVDMGFPRSVCETALSRTQNNLNLATEFLLASPVLVQRARDEESARSQTNAGTTGLPAEDTSPISVEPIDPGTNEENETSSNPPIESTPDELMRTSNDVLGTGDSLSTTLSSSIDPPADSSDSVDVLMGEASIAGPSSEIMGDVESSTHDEGDDILATPKAPEKLSPRLGPKSTGPDEIRSRMMSTLGKLRDPIRSYFLKRSMDLAESYEGLAFDLKAAFKAFENKPFILDDNKPFDGILSLINDLQELVHDEQTVRSGTLSSHPPALSVRLRVLALLANDSMFEASLQRHAAALFALIIKLLQKAPLFSDSLEASLIPPWLASALLVVEAILAHGKNKPASELTNSQPMPEEIEENDEDKDDDEDENGNEDADDRMAEASTSRSNKNTMAKDLMPMEPPEKDLDLLFHICTNLLRCRMCGRHDFLAAIRVLLLLTQKHSVAEAFLSSGVPAILLRSFSFKTESRGCLPYAAMLLRHTVESSAVKRSIMKKEIVHFVTSHSRHRQADLPSFCRHIAPMAWRDWKTLMDCISGVCKLIPNAGTGGSWIIGLVEEKDQNNPDVSGKKNPGLKIPSREVGASEIQMEDTTPEKPFEDVSWKPAVDGSMQFLMSELLKAGKDCLSPPETSETAIAPNLPGIIRPPLFSQASNIAAISGTEPSDSSIPTSGNNLTSAVVLPANTNLSKTDKGDEQQVAAFSHACFIMSWMSELLASYNECKISFMSLHHRKGKSPTKAAHSLSQLSSEAKSKHEILNFMLCDLIPTGPLSQPNTTESQKKSAIASWAIMVLVALCHEPNAGKEPSEIVTSVRSFVLGGLARAIQDAIVSEEPVDARYGRLYALSDLTFRLLTAAPFAQRLSANPSDAPMQIAKIMLEKNFAAMLTNALADVDLNFPSVQRLLNSILRPLEHLTKVVTKIGRASTDRKTGDSIGGAASAVEVESVTSESSAGDEEMAAEDEDAPDLYRNSALGLYEGELEPGHRDNTPSSEGEDQFDDEDADMDDLDEGAMLGSDLSDASDEDGDVIAEIGRDTDTSEGDHDDEDDDDDEDEDEDEDDEDGDNDEDDEDEDDDDDEDDDNHADHDVHNADLEMEIADRVGGSIGLPEALGNSNTMDEDTRTLMSFLNSGPPDLGLQAGTSQILQATREGADIEDALEDDEGVSIADQPNAVDDVFEGGSIDFGDDVVVDHGGGENRAEAAPWSWNGVLPFQPRGEIQTAAGGMGSHHSLLHQATDNVFGRTRGGQQNAGISTHPLLVEDSTAPTRGDGLNRSQRRMDIRSGSVDQWINAIENLLGGGAGQLIEQILGNVAYGQRPIHIDLGQGPNGPSLGGVVIDPQRGVVMPVGPQGLQAPISQTTPTSRLDRHLADRVAGQTLMPLATLPRWSEEARVFHQTTSASENPTKIQRAVLALLVPRAKKIAKEEVIEKDKQAKLAHEKRSISEQRTESSTTATENLPDDGALSATQGLDTENMEEAASSGLTLLPPELPDPNSDSTATRAPTEDSEMHDGTAESGNDLLDQSRQQESSNGTAINESTMQDNGVQDDVAEVMNLARQLAARIGGSAEGQSDSSQTGSEAHSNSQSHVQAGTDNQTTPAVNPSLQQNSTDDAPIAASSSNVEIVAEGTSSNAAPERVTIMISGAEVDITDTGIDPTFLEALPDDMREEVLNQHFREQRPAREELSVPVPSSISTDFLDALPPEIRAEVIRSEVAAEERRRREEDLERRNTTSGSATRALSASADLDPATFLASLDPTLREAVLLDQDEGFISTLPRNILAEVDALRDRMSRRHHAIRSARERDPLGGLATTSGASQIGTSSKKTLVKADTVQVLDRSGIAALVRLMFFPQPLRRHSLQKVLVNLCENSRSRTELIGTLLGLLQDGTRDAATIDRSFSQVSSRAIKALVPPTPKSTGKLRREAHIGPLPQFPGESVPNLIALRCLEALSLLVTANDRVPIYFLTEQEVPVVLHKRSAKKGKGKEKSNTSVTYPLVGLLALLDRDSLLKQPNLTESITSLLALISRPLTALAKKLEDTKPQASGTSSLGALFLSVPEDSTNPDSSSLSLNPSGGPMTSGNASQGPVSKKTEAPSNVLEKAPILAPNDLRMIVNVLDSGECSSKTFSHTVTFIQALSTAPHGREVIAAELLERAQFLGEALLPDLDELAGAIKEAPNAAEVRSVTLAKFSSASAQQAKLLRILKTTEFLDSHVRKDEAIQLPLPDPTSPLTMTSNDLFSPSGPNPTLDDPSAPKIRFRPLWEKLSHCLTLIQERDDMIHIATVLLPLMESFLVVCKHVGISSAKSHRGTQSPRIEDASLDVMTRFFLSFTESHRKVLNTMVRNNPGLMSGSFSILVHNPKVLEFDNKRNYFSQQLHKARSREQHGNVQLNVRRPHVFEDSFHSLARRTGDELKYGKLSVRFYDEEGVDAGGVTREWLTILVKQMLDPNYALFTGSAADSKTYQPNRASSVNPDHLGFFTFCGRVIGKALYDGRVVDAYFTLAFYKHLLGVGVGLSDLESVDPDHHRSLKWMLENDIDEIFELTFSVEADDFGSTRIVDLKPDGRNIPVTNENKAEYVQLLVQNRLTVSIQEQIDAFKKGFDEIIPRDLVRIFSATELQLLLNGLPDINVEDWRANTELHQFQQSDSTVTWFWRAVRSFDQEERAKLLQFATGSSRVPLEGFGALQGAQGATKFSLVNAHTKNILPSAHTCFNQIDLPSYNSYEDLRKMLLIAISEGSEGFGFA